MSSHVVLVSRRVRAGPGDVLHEQREPARLGLDLGHVHQWYPGADAGGDLAVEAHLDFVGAQR